MARYMSGPAGNPREPLHVQLAVKLTECTCNSGPWQLQQFHYWDCAKNVAGRAAARYSTDLYFRLSSEGTDAS